MTPVQKPFGFNLIAHVSANLGLGVAARSIARTILDRGIPLATHDVVDAGRRSGHDRSFDAYATTDVTELPYAVNLFILGVPTIRRLLDSHPSLGFRDDVLQAALCFWELPSLPPKWIPTLEAMDLVIGVSHFMRHAFQFKLSGPTIIGGTLPVPVPPNVVPSRDRFRIPHDAVAFVASFEPYSDPARKNVFAVVDAFKRGAGTDPRAHLVVHVNNAQKEDGHMHEVVQSLRLAAGDDRRIDISTDAFTYADVLSLYASCDVYVSLHRAEGFGLGMAEAMTLGKPVVATDWSGNLTFMNHRNAALVGYRLVPVDGATPIYGREQLEDDAVWADPDVGIAARWIVRLIADPALRSSIGDAARSSLAEYAAAAERGDFLDEIRAIHDRVDVIRAKRDAISPGTTHDGMRLGRLARIQALERELAWIKSRPAYRIPHRRVGADADAGPLVATQRSSTAMRRLAP